MRKEQDIINVNKTNYKKTAQSNKGEETTHQ
jgi:hypothetical protein